MVEIDCHFIESREYGDLIPGWNDNVLKKGRYHGSSFAVDGFGIDRWVVCAKLVANNYNHYVTVGLTDEQIVEGCIEYLNKPPPRKKYQRRAKKPLYGELSLHQFVKKENEQGAYFEVLLVTDQRKNKHFWSEGQASVCVPAKLRRKKRKKK